MLPALLQDISAKKWRLLSFVSLITIVALVISLLLPKQYLSQASLLPANSRMMDKQRIYGENIQELYSAFGSSEDLDRVFAAIQSSAVLQTVSDSLRLVDHYQLTTQKNARTQAAQLLKKHIKIKRSEYGELQLYVWDQEAVMAQKIAALLITKTQTVFDEMYQHYYNRSIQNLQREWADTLSKKRTPEETAFISNKISEFEVARLNPPPAFIVMEQPLVSDVPDKPNMVLNVAAAALLASFAALFFMTIRLALRTT